MPVSTTPFTHPEGGLKILTEEDRERISHDREIQDLKRMEEGQAKFKIEVMFDKGFSLTKPSAGIVSFWESGSQLHGGGDAIIHFCPGKKLKKSDCESYIPDPAHGYGFLICPKCHVVWNGDDVDGQVAARLSTQHWADLIYNYYQRLGMNCDIVIKYHAADIRNAAKTKNSHDALASVRSESKRIKRIYRLSAIIRDTSAGASLYDRILAFVRA